MVGVLVMMLTISWQMTLVALLIVPVSMGFVMIIIRQSQKYFKQQQDYLGHVNGHVEEMYGGHNMVKAFNGEAKSIQKFDKFNTTCMAPPGNPVYLGHDDAGDGLYRQPGLCGGHASWAAGWQCAS